MRPHLLDPTAGNPHLDEAIELGRQIYDHYEAGEDYSECVKRLGLIAGHPIHAFAVHSAFGSVSPETFARRQLIAWDQLPTDVTEEEMLEMLERMFKPKGYELEIQYWVECLRVNTGDEKVSDLIFWTGEYFGDGDNTREMTPKEMLATALKAGSARSDA
jgi:hypothetical protein